MLRKLSFWEVGQSCRIGPLQDPPTYSKKTQLNAIDMLDFESWKLNSFQSRLIHVDSNDWLDRQEPSRIDHTSKAHDFSVGVLVKTHPMISDDWFLAIKNMVPSRNLEQTFEELRSPSV